MKFGVRKPSLKRRLKARTTGKWKRQLKRSINPYYGKKGMGWIRNPRKAAYNKVYNKTTVSADKMFANSKRKGNGKKKGCGCLPLILFIIILAFILM